MREKLFLQFFVVLACIVPIGGGLYGIYTGIGAPHNDADSHFRYLSGLLLGIGLVFLFSVPHIETYKWRFLLLTFIVFIGGAARLYGVLEYGLPGHITLFALVMELIVTPLLCLWQFRIARKLY